jgi:hypothetical protein
MHHFLEFGHFDVIGHINAIQPKIDNLKKPTMKFSIIDDKAFKHTNLNNNFKFNFL